MPKKHKHYIMTDKGMEELPAPKQKSAKKEGIGFVEFENGKKLKPMEGWTECNDFTRPPKEKWEEEFDKEFCLLNDLGQQEITPIRTHNYSRKDPITTPYAILAEDLKDFIRNLIEKARKEERKSFDLAVAKNAETFSKMGIRKIRQEARQQILQGIEEWVKNEAECYGGATMTGNWIDANDILAKLKSMR